MITSEMFDLETGTMQTLHDFHKSKVKYKYSATLLNNGQVLFSGGSDARDWRGKFAMAMLQDNSVLITEGYEMNIICTKEAWLYQPKYKNQVKLSIIREGSGLDARK